MTSEQASWLDLVDRAAMYGLVTAAAITGKVLLHFFFYGVPAESEFPGAVELFRNTLRLWPVVSLLWMPFLVAIDSLERSEGDDS